MKATIFAQHGGVEALAIEEVPDPVCGPGDVIIRVGATSLNGFDPMILSGSTGLKTPLPMTPCGDFAGELVELGADVAGWQVGDRGLRTVHGHSIYLDLRTEHHRLKRMDARRTGSGPGDGRGGRPEAHHPCNPPLVGNREIHARTHRSKGSRKIDHPSWCPIGGGKMIDKLQSYRDASTSYRDFGMQLNALSHFSGGMT
jgi:hypothetical protein